VSSRSDGASLGKCARANDERIIAANDNLSIHEEKNRGVYVKGLTDVYVGSEMEVFDVMKAGARSRVVASTRKWKNVRTDFTGSRLIDDLVVY
jgi:hypothetical protein